MARILVVEDNALNIKLFCDLLSAHGHEARAVTDSREALGQARAFDPDLVITDIQLPHIDGMELMRLLRSDADRLRRVPIMAVTAYAGEGDDERIRRAGAQAYVSKPISVVRFIETVEGLLEQGHVPPDAADAHRDPDAQTDDPATDHADDGHDESGPETGTASTRDEPADQQTSQTPGEPDDQRKLI